MLNSRKLPINHKKVPAIQKGRNSRISWNTKPQKESKGIPKTLIDSAIPKSARHNINII